jgi:hypothetical protein
MTATAILQQLSPAGGRDRRHSVKIVSRLEVIPVTATPTESPYTSIMERMVDEAQYVLAVLYRKRDEVSANPELFDPAAHERIDEAIARIEDVLRSTRSQLMVWSVEQKVKAA